MGVMLILFGILIVTGGVRLIAEAMIRWMPGFATIG
jgi:cytochrome c-type biogenesis protein